MLPHAESQQDGATIPPGYNPTDTSREIDQQQRMVFSNRYRAHRNEENPFDEEDRPDYAG
jgi:hypothetical protein